ncbi:GGDEF domain-containing phosphodiesterase [Ruminococcus sp.]|uniref:GGDEF domain-containing phosphodiesterase n=1 Tax=Ruminococcus sp. TaxID=41978 RepID=UPI0025F230E8|nr:GGDEF domain-containing phosphodiesterase [Ruminococcus sp.]MBQ8965947.1 EAL domain-containing protein [Ruminococcus sp.]
MPFTSQFKIVMYAASMLICGTGLLFTLLNRRTDKTQNKIYVSTLIMLILNCISEIVAAVAQPYSTTSPAAAFLENAGNYTYFLIHIMVSPVFFFYVLVVCGANIKGKKKRYILCAVPCILGELTVALNPVTKWVYYYDNNMLYHRNWALMLLYAGAGLYIVMAVFMLMFSWRALNPKRRIALIYFFALVIGGLCVQFYFFDLRTELMGEALALLGVMISIEIEDDRIDADMGIYNRRALSADMNTYLVSDRSLYLLCVKITNTEIIKRATGSDSTDALSRLVAEYLRTLVPRYYIYSSSPGTFIITLLDENEQKAVWLANTIITRFEEPWDIGDNVIPLKATVMAASVPDRIKSVSDALYMADSPVPKKLEKNILTDSDLDYLLRRAAVESAISKGLDAENFEVFYQPTYHVGTRRLHGAEALIRLHDPDLGNLFPDEFIPIAEQIGLIDEIDAYVLRQVCEFIKSGIPARYGMDCINVNLSVLEFMQPAFVDRIVATVTEFGIDTKMINFEITETIAASDYITLSRVVRALKKQGFRFSMDDYGTGYSNMQSIFRLDFDIVKIDKSILWSAEKGQMGRIILDSSVRMIRQMKRKILVEGVETEQQLKMIRNLGVDFAQGYLFSRPISKTDFITLLEKEL